MLHMIEPHTRTKIGMPLRVNSMSLNLNERNSTATVVLDDLEGIKDKELHTQWFYDDSEPGAQIVWREKSVTVDKHTKTPTMQLEHIINVLKDTVLFEEVKPSDITGHEGDTKCSAKKAIKYILSRQPQKDWKLDAFDPAYETEDYEQEYSFQGTETLYDALESVCATLEDCWWTLDTHKYPFVIDIWKNEADEDATTQLRAGRNLRTISVTQDKSGMFTRFYPIGYEDLHYTSSTDGAHYREKNVSKYGLIEKTATDESLTTNSELRNWAKTQLSRHAMPIVTIEVEGLELSQATGESLDRIHLGELCEVILHDDGERYVQRVIEMRYQDKISQPEVVKITMSNKREDVKHQRGITGIVSNDQKVATKSARVQARKSKENKTLILNTVKEVRITGPTNNEYTLQYLLVSGNKDKAADWKSGGNFSRAVASWSVDRKNGYITVTAHPQEQSKEVDARMLEPTWSSTPGPYPSSNSNTVTIRSLADDSKSIVLYMSRGVWSKGKRKIYVGHTDSSEANRVAYIEVDASISGPTWARDPAIDITGNSNTATVSSMTGQSIDIPLLLQRGPWSGGKRYIYLHYRDSSSTNRIARIDVDARLSGPDWTRGPSADITGNTNTATVSCLTGQSIEIPLLLQRTNWNAGKRYVYLHYSDSSDANRVARVDIDASLSGPSWARGPAADITGNTNTATVSSATGQSIDIPLLLQRTPWSSGKRFVYLHYSDSSDANRLARVDIDASLSGPSWARGPAADITGNTNTATVSSATGQSIDIPLLLQRTQWNSGKRFVYLHYSDSSDANRLARVDIDASLSEPSWARGPAADITGNTNSVTVSSATGQSKTISLLLERGEWDEDTQDHRPVYLCKDSSSASNRLAKIDIDASSRMNSARNHVSVTGPSWDHTPGGSHINNSNEATFSTDAPNPASGTSASLALYMDQDNWSSGSKTVYVSHTNSSTDNMVAKLSISIPSITVNTQISTYGDTYPSSVDGGDISKSGIVAGKYMTMIVACGGKKQTIRFRVVA